MTDTKIRPPAYPRTIGWVGTAALAMGGSNQSLFLIAGATGLVASQGSAAVPLLILGLILSWMAAPGWTELVLMWPNRVGGIASCCVEAFRPYSPILANLAGTCYWWGWVPTCGVAALLSASAIHEWYLPHTPVPALATGLVLFFMAVNLCGVKWVTRLVIPTAALSAILAFLSGLIPVFTGHMDWHQAATFHLKSPFHGVFGGVTSAMAGLYLIGFAAPAFEAAACHVGETVNPIRNVPRAMLASALMASVYFVLLPVVWLGTLGPLKLTEDLMLTLGPTFAPLLGSAAKAAAIWFMMVNMFHGTIQPLAGAARTLSQMAEDGMLPDVFARRSRTNVPWVATVLTAGMAVIFLLIGDPVWMIAAANLTYLIGIALPSVAVWLLRRDLPQMPRPYRAPRGTVELGVVAAAIWGVSTVLGFEQFGLPTVLFGLALAYSGSVLYAFRCWQDRRRMGQPVSLQSMHVKLTGAMLLVLALDGGGYLLAISSIEHGHPAMVAALQDIFVAVALLTITVGLVLPGMIAHAAQEVAQAAQRLATGTLADLSRAMAALGAGRLEEAYARIDVQPIVVHSCDELELMADSFNVIQECVVEAVQGLDQARAGLGEARQSLNDTNSLLEAKVGELELAIQTAEAASLAKSQFLANMSHELRTPMNSILGFSEIIQDQAFGELNARQAKYISNILTSGHHLLGLINDILDLSKVEAGHMALEYEVLDVAGVLDSAGSIVKELAGKKGLSMTTRVEEGLPPLAADPVRLKQVLYNLLSNAIKFTPDGGSIVVLARDAGGGLEVEVTDTGIGLRPADLEHIFGEFEQVDSSYARQQQGTGLGLSLTRRLVEMHGGRVWAESRGPNQGSTFRVGMPWFPRDAVGVLGDTAPSPHASPVLSRAA